MKSCLLECLLTNSVNECCEKRLDYQTTTTHKEEKGMSNIVSTETAAEFISRVERMFVGGKRPACNDLLTLVPSGAENEAVPGSFGVDGVFKYVFMSADGIRICVKYHRRHKGARGGSNCNSYRYCTAQFQIGRKLLFIDPDKGTYVSRKPDNWSHLPIEDF